MLSATIKVNLIKDEKETEVEVVLQQASPFVTSDIMLSNLAENNQYKIGSVVKDMMGVVIISPKNLIEQIEEAENSYPAISQVFKAVNSFCNNPKRFCLLQKESEIKAEDMAVNNS